MKNTMAFPGFEQRQFSYQDHQGKAVSLSYWIGGEGPPLLLLHGFPQTKSIWHRVAPTLIKQFRMVIPDLRGYGASSYVPSDETHQAYSKRTMAQDQLALMTSLGYSQFSLCGHDRGGRVGHRLAMDYPQVVSRLMLLDISPTYTMYRKTDQVFATGYWHWFFLIQPYPIPETMIMANPEFWMKQHMDRAGGIGLFDPACWQEYLSCVSSQQRIHAMCEDYRAASTIDLVHDQEDRNANKKIQAPIRVLWGQKGIIQHCFNPLEDWQQVALQSVTGRALPCGHYIPEELPHELIVEMREFFT